MTPRMGALIQDAKRAGYDVRATSSGGTLIVVKRHKGTGEVLHGLEIDPSGTAMDASVHDLDVRRGFRDYATMRKILRLQPEVRRSR